MATRPTAKTTAKTNTNECVIKCNPNKAVLGCGYTRVRVQPQTYSSIVLIASMTGKTLQDVTDELLTFAIENTSVELNGNTIKFSDIKEVK